MRFTHFSHVQPRYPISRSLQHIIAKLYPAATSHLHHNETCRPIPCAITRARLAYSRVVTRKGTAEGLVFSRHMLNPANPPCPAPPPNKKLRRHHHHHHNNRLPCVTLHQQQLSLFQSIILSQLQPSRLHISGQPPSCLQARLSTRPWPTPRSSPPSPATTTCWSSTVRHNPIPCAYHQAKHLSKLTPSSYCRPVQGRHRRGHLQSSRPWHVRPQGNPHFHPTAAPHCTTPVSRKHVLRWLI